MALETTTKTQELAAVASATTIQLGFYDLKSYEIEVTSFTGTWHIEISNGGNNWTEVATGSGAAGVANITVDAALARFRLSVYSAGSATCIWHLRG